jgi:hypothetical protein
VGTGFKGVATVVVAGRAGGVAAVFGSSAAGVVAVQTVVKNAAASEMRRRCSTVFMRVTSRQINRLEANAYHWRMRSAAGLLAGLWSGFGYR